MYDLELEGHDDTIILGADDGSNRLTVACGLGKYLGDTHPSTLEPRFGVFTRHTSECDVERMAPGSCAQCRAALEPALRFDAIPADWRWRTDFQGFVSTEWPEWRDDGAGGCAHINLGAMGTLERPFGGDPFVFCLPSDLLGLFVLVLSACCSCGAQLGR